MSEKITGEKLEQIFDLCYEHDLFDFIFDKEDSLLTPEEWEVYSEYAARMKEFIKEVGKDKTTKKTFAMSGEEKEIVAKIDKVSNEREKYYKKTLVKKENRPFVKALANLLTPKESPYEIQEAMQEVTGKLTFLKETFRNL